MATLCFKILLRQGYETAVNFTAGYAYVILLFLIEFEVFEHLGADGFEGAEGPTSQPVD